MVYRAGTLLRRNRYGISRQITRAIGIPEPVTVIFVAIVVLISVALLIWRGVYIVEYSDYVNIKPYFICYGSLVHKRLQRKSLIW